MAMKLRGKLTAARVERLSKLGRHGDGHGLYLQVSNVAGRVTKSWVFRYVSLLSHPSGKRRDSKGKPKLNWVRDLGLGSADVVDIDEARKRAQAERNKLYAGLDPIEERRMKEGARKAETMRAVTFRQCAEDYVKSVAPTWRGGITGRQAQQWTQSLTDYVYPVIGQLPIATVDRAHVLAVLKPHWETKTITMERVRGRVEAVLDYAKGHDLRSGDNPAALKGNLDAVLPKVTKLKKVEHMAALPYADVPAFMAKLRSTDGVLACLAEFTILTAARVSEVTGARWNEIDLEAGVWTVPAGRMKMDRDHRVPLSDRALEILAALSRGGEYVFSSSSRADRPIWGTVPLALVKRIAGDADITLHGFRSSFKDWATDCTHTQREIIEAALAHKVGDAVEAAYRRSDALAKRCDLMNAWASWCGGEPIGANVVQLKSAA
jgi:integrase